MSNYRAWAILIPRIEEVLELDIKSQYKCVIIEWLIKEERGKDE